MSRPARVLIAALAPVLVVAVSCSSNPPASPSSSPTTPAGPALTGTALTGSTVAGGGSTGFGVDEQAQFTKVLVDARAQFGFAGVQAGVWTPNGTWVGTSGTAGPNDKRAPQAKDHTRIGSVTKTFTTTLILQLVEDGKLSLDDPVNRYVPGMPNGATATIRQLMNMTSGIPSYTADAGFQQQLFGDPETEWLPNELVSIVAGHRPSFEPGKGWEYSNTNTVLLGMVIEKVTGRQVAAVLSERILAPLALNQTTLPANGVLPEPHLVGLTEQGQPEGSTVEATNWNPSWAFTAGAMISTLDDLHRWGVALGTGEGILKPETQQQRLASFITDIAPNTPDRGYGLGLGRTDGWIGHTGELPGYNTVVMYRPELQATIVVMVNSDIPVDGQNPAPTVFAGLAKIVGDQAVGTFADEDDDLAHPRPSGSTGATGSTRPNPNVGRDGGTTIVTVQGAPPR